MIVESFVSWRFLSPAVAALNRIGPRTVPCGTPREVKLHREYVEPTRTQKERWVKNSSNHLLPFRDNSKHSLRWHKVLSCDMESKAFWMSNEIIAALDGFPTHFSIASIIVCSAATRASVVPRPALNPYCWLGNLSSICLMTCKQTKRSAILLIPTWWMDVKGHVSYHFFNSNAFTIESLPHRSAHTFIFTLKHTHTLISISCWWVTSKFFSLPSSI